jgi:urea carboxylase
MLGQVRPGDTVRLVPVSPDDADAAAVERDRLLAAPRLEVAVAFERALGRTPTTPAGSAPSRLSCLPGSARVSRAPARLVTTRDRSMDLVSLPGSGHAPPVRIRRAGDSHLLLEAGPAVLDLTVRMWVHLLANSLREQRLSGVLELVEGVRSMLVTVDRARLRLPELAGRLGELAADVPDPGDVVLPVRDVTLPIAFDHPLAHEAMARYMRGVRPDAPWCPDNVEFIRRINDLDRRGDVFDIVSAATYLVVGLGDVYLGAPVAVPIDPRHRLVTTKYDPARTWTPQNAVGIGGVYLCVYGMEGPGGYQLVGRTVPVWRHLPGSDEKPWLLRQFDRLRFRAVSAEELADLRADITAGRADLEARPATFRLAEEHRLLAEHAGQIATFRARREAAFAAERARWDSVRP